MITILLADDHQLVREGLRALLEARPDCFVVGEAADGLEVFGLVEHLKPDVLILDLMMPGLNGLEIIRQVSEQVPETQILILSMHADQLYVLEALRNGAAGYVLKETDSATLMEAVHTVAAGERYFSFPLSEQEINDYINKIKNSRPDDPYETLTKREREVFYLAIEGHSATEIAARLSISPRTVEAHRAGMMRKLGLRNQTDLIRYAIRRKILPVETR